jgi:CRP-like cAMP-binding protein
VEEIANKLEYKPEAVDFQDHCVKVLGPNVADLSSGDSFGEMSLMNDAPCSASIIALTPVQMVCITKEDYLKLPMLKDLVYRPGHCSAIFQKEPEDRIDNDVNEIMTFCKNMKLFSQIDDTLLRRMCTVMKHVDLPARCQVPLHSDESGSIMYVILSGSVSVHAGGSTGISSSGGSSSLDGSTSKAPTSESENENENGVASVLPPGEPRKSIATTRPGSKQWWTRITTVSTMIKRGQNQRKLRKSIAQTVRPKRLDVNSGTEEKSSTTQERNTTEEWNPSSLGICMDILTAGDSFGEMSSLVKLRGTDGTAAVVTREPTSAVIVQHELYLEVAKIANFVESPQLCREILKKDPYKRSEANIGMLCRLLENASSDSVMFNQLPEALKQKMCKFMRYEKHEEGGVVIQQGDPGSKMFIVLTGSASVYMNPQRSTLVSRTSRVARPSHAHKAHAKASIAEVSGSHLKRILASQYKGQAISGSRNNLNGILMGVMHPGDVFGERSLLKGVPRGATVIARGTTLELLTLDRDDFSAVEALENALKSARAQGNIHPGFEKESRDMIKTNIKNVQASMNEAEMHMDEGARVLMKLSYLKSLERFHSLDNADKMSLAGVIVYKKVEKDQTIFDILPEDYVYNPLSPQAAVPKEMFVIASGKVGIINNQGTQYQILSEGISLSLSLPPPSLPRALVHISIVFHPTHYFWFV